jgi:hypothetical protein
VRHSLRELLEEFDGEISVEMTHSNHFKVTVGTQALVYISGTPGDYRALAKIRADIRRALRRTEDRA